MIDIQLLRMMRARSDYNRIVSTVTINALDTNTRLLLEGIGRYYKKFPTHDRIDFPTFTPYFLAINRLNDDDKEVFTNIIRNMAKQYPDEATRHGIMENLHELNLAHKVSTMVERYNSGEDIQIAQELSGAVDKYKKELGVTKMPEVSENIDELLDNVGNDEGVHWRLPCLNRAMRPLRGGDTVIVAARSDQGKTSFFASEVTFMAPQLPEGRCVLWLNNEGPGYRIRPRLMQAAMGCLFRELAEMREEGTLYDRYYEAIGGANRIRVMDVHGFNTAGIEALIQQTNPGIVISDMIDNIRGFSSEARTDLQLEKMYQWMRELSVKYDFINLPSSQISAEGENVIYPSQSMLKDSKTGKQGASDAILMIGSKENDLSYASTRWLSLPKNKLRKATSGGALQESVRFDRDRVRFETMEEA